MKLPAAIALMCLPAAFAQAPASLNPLDTVLTAHSTLIVVPALVRNKAGEPVFTLAVKDFILTDDGIEQKLTLEEDTGGEPLALVVVVETGGAGARQLDKYHTLGTMIDSLAGNVKHKVAVVEFDSDPRLFQSFTSNANTIQDAMDSLSPRDQGAAILDGLAFALDLLRKQPPECRRAILLLSETVDIGSHTKLAEAVQAISDTNTSIYSIGFSPENRKHRATPPENSRPSLAVCGWRTPIPTLLTVAWAKTLTPIPTPPTTRPSRPMTASPSSHHPSFSPRWPPSPPPTACAPTSRRP
jgi:hypothetical protein